MKMAAHKGFFNLKNNKRKVSRIAGRLDEHPEHFQVFCQPGDALITVCSGRTSQITGILRTLFLSLK
jgi:hypothetical protein